MNVELDNKLTACAQRNTREDGTCDQDKAAAELIKSLNRGEQDVVLTVGAKSLLALKTHAIEKEAQTSARAAMSGQTSLLFDLEATIVVDDAVGSKPTRLLSEREATQYAEKLRKKRDRLAAESQRWDQTLAIFRPIWKEHPDWNMGQCDEELRRLEIAGGVSTRAA